MQIKSKWIKLIGTNIYIFLAEGEMSNIQMKQNIQL